MIIDIKEIEKRLHLNLKRNTFVVGVDTASITGIAIIETTEKQLKLETSLIRLPVIKKDEETSEKFVQKLESMLEQVREFKKTILTKKKPSSSILVLENSFLGVNVVTFGLLRMLCGIVFSELYDNFESVKILFPSSARKIVGFKSELKRGTPSKEKKQEIITWINNICKTNYTNDNETDAIILALCGLIKQD